MDATTELRQALDQVIRSTELLTAAVRNLQQLIALDDYQHDMWTDAEWQKQHRFAASHTSSTNISTPHTKRTDHG